MNTATDYLTAVTVGQLSVPRVTFVGVQSFGGLAMLLVNNAAGSTKALVAYDDESPVIFSEVA